MCPILTNNTRTIHIRFELLCLFFSFFFSYILFAPICVNVAACGLGTHGWRRQQTKAAIRANRRLRRQRRPVAPIKCEIAIYLKKSTVSMGIECCAGHIVIYFYGNRPATTARPLPINYNGINALLKYTASQHRATTSQRWVTIFLRNHFFPILVPFIQRE